MKQLHTMAVPSNDRAQGPRVKLPDTTELACLSVADLAEIAGGVLRELIIRLLTKLETRIPSSMPAPTDDHLLTVDEAAARLCVNKQFVYRHQSQLGAVRLGPATLRLSARAINDFLIGKRQSEADKNKQ